MKRTVNIVVTFDLDENYLGGAVITPKEISRELIRKDIADLYVYEEGFQDLTVDVVDE